MTKHIFEAVKKCEPDNLNPEKHFKEYWLENQNGFYFVQKNIIGLYFPLSINFMEKNAFFMIMLVVKG